jgi:autotransporter-associated beta strand protein
MTPALAGTDTWTGIIGGPCLSGDTPWSAAGPCWSTGAPPANGDDVVLDQDGPSSPSIYDINRTLNSITLNTPPFASITSYTINNAGGFLLGLQSGGFIVDNNTEGADAINTGVTLNGPATITLSTGAVGLSFGVNPITGTGPLTLVNNGTDDALQFLVANTYTGATIIDGTGRVFAAVNGAIPTGSALTVNGSVLFGESSTIGSLAGGGSVFMNGNNTLIVGGDNTSTTFSGVYQDSGGAAALTKTGTGTLILTGNNTYTGGTTITGGMLQLGNGGASGSILGNVINNGIFAINRSDTLTFGNVISGTGAFQQKGPGATILTGNNSYAGGTALNAGTLAVGSSTALGTGALTFANGTTLQAAGNGLSLANAMTLNGADTVDTQANTLTLAGVLSGTGGLTKIGTGTLTLSGANTYSGGTTLAGGTLSLANNQALGTGALTTTGSVVDYANGVTIANPIVINGNTTQLQVTTGSATQAGAISELNGPRPLEKIGAGTLILTAANTYSGTTSVNAGTLQAGALNAFAPSSAFTIAGGATLDLNNFNQTIGSLAGAGNVMLGAATLTSGGDNTSTTYSGVMSGTGGLVKTGAGTLVLAGANTYSGGTTLAGGTLSLANDQALGTGALTTTGSVVDYADGVTIANPIVINSNTTQLQVTTGSATQAGAISELNGPRPLEKIGAGALILTAANTYTGPTTISAGTLIVNGSIASSAVTVNAGATLAGTGTVGATTILSGGTFAPGSGTPGSSMTVAGNLAFQSGALYLVQVNSSNASSANVIAAAAPRSPAPSTRRSRQAATSRARTRSCRPRAGSAAPPSML